MSATDNNADRLPLRPPHRGLQKQLSIKGAERNLVMIAGLFGVMVGFVDTVGFGPQWGVPLGVGVTLGLFWVAREMGKVDILMSQVVRRSLKYRKNYAARGRPSAKVPPVYGYR